MNNYYYSATTNGFYHDSMKEDYEKSANGWPQDAVLLSYELYKSLFEGQSKGKMIKAGKDGMPILVDRPGPTKEENISMAKSQRRMLLKHATEEITPLQDAVDLNMATAEEKTKLIAWKKYRVLLNRVDIRKAPDVTWPESPEPKNVAG